MGKSKVKRRVKVRLAQSITDEQGRCRMVTQRLNKNQVVLEQEQAAQRRSMQLARATKDDVQFLQSIELNTARYPDDSEDAGGSDTFHSSADGNPDGDECDWITVSSDQGGQRSYHSLAQSLYEVSGKRKYADDRTRNDRILKQQEAWSSQYDALVAEYLKWDCDGPIPYGAPPENDSQDVMELLCVDLFEQKYLRFQGSSVVNATLVRHGYIGNAPWAPSVAVSLKLLLLYKTVSTRCPKLGIQAFAQSLCDLQQLPYRPCFRGYLSQALDVYNEIRRRVDLKVNIALGREGDWRIRNACPSCTYRLEGEKKLKYSMLTTMDGNDSLKRVERVRHKHDDNGNIISTQSIERQMLQYPNHYYMNADEVDQFKNEVRGRAAIRNDANNLVLIPNVVHSADDASEPAPLDGADPNNPCVSRWKNMAEDSRKTMWGIFSETGFFICLCRHGFVLTCCDMIRSGELAKYGLAVTNKLLESHGPNQCQGYDIGCSFSSTADHAEITGPKVREADHMFCCGSFHGHAHCRLCQIDWHPLYRTGCGLESFEGCERFFYESNAVAGRTRHMSVYHRQQAIIQHLERWDSDKYLYLSRNLYVAFRRAVANITALQPEVDAAKVLYGITSDDVFPQWLSEEKEYLQGLKTEPPTDILKVEYVSTLAKLLVAERDLEKVSESWRHIPAEQLCRMDFYQRQWKSTARLENARSSCLQMVLTLQSAVTDLENKLEIEKRWDPGCVEWQTTSEYISKRDYYHAIDVLEGLVVSRLFELSKMNQSGLCYKLRSKIAQALKARAGAIRTAVEKYNACAAVLPEPRPPLDIKDVLEYVFLAEFDLLRDSRHGLESKPWARPGERQVLNSYYKICRSHEELDRICIETRRLQSWIDQEERQLRERLGQLQRADRLLAYQLDKKYQLRVRMNLRHQEYITWIQNHRLWRGARGIGTPIGLEATSDLDISSAIRREEVNLSASDVVALPLVEEEEAAAEDEIVDPQPIEFVWNLFVEQG